MKEARLLPHGEAVTFQPGPCTIALDGEREIEFRHPSAKVTVRLDPRGPRVVDVDAALSAAATAGVFLRGVEDLNRAEA